MSLLPDPKRLAGAGEEGRSEDAEDLSAAELAAAVAAAGAAGPVGEEPAAATIPAAGRAGARGRRQWPLPRQADPDAPLLVVEGLTTHFRLGADVVYAVDDVSFTLGDGEALGIAGESGCGKTTTALSLLRLLPSNAEVVAGSVKLFGIDLRTKSDNAIRRYRWREISIIFQGAMNALNPVQRIGDQIAEPMIERQGLSKAAAATKARELLELVGIPKARAKAYPHELSGGMRQRAMIAMALACDPAVIIGDEPTTALDVMVQAQILELLEDLREKLGLSLILITHDLSVLAETCDRVMIMYAGRVAEEGPVGTVYRTPRHPYTQMLLAAFPDVHSGRRDLGTIPGTPPDLRTPPPGCRFHPRCPAVMDVCRTEVPVEVRFEDRVRVACHLYPPGSDGVPRHLPPVARAEAATDARPAGPAGPAGAAAAAGEPA
jgi:oligopeptide/dipeptide ABC transporter ATP-binding protein